MKIHPVGVELFHADTQTDGHTDMMKLIFAFHNFENAPNNVPFRFSACENQNLYKNAHKSDTRDLTAICRHISTFG
jgi:hypothetical protein